jgi:threonine dehydratase
MEILRGAEPLDALYVPIGLGSGICGALAARDASGVQTEVVGVVAENAPAIALSMESGTLRNAPSTTIADGMACRTPNAEAFATLLQHRPRLVMVSDSAIAAAARALFTDTHNVAEGAGAAAFAAALADPQRERYRSVGVVLSGGNVDADIFGSFLAGQRT